MEREEAVPTRPPAAGHPRTAADADPFGPQGHTCYPHRPGWPPPPLPSSSAAALAGGEPTAAMRAAWGSGGGERFVRGEKRRRRRREIGGGNSSPWWGRSFFFVRFFFLDFLCVCVYFGVVGLGARFYLEGVVGGDFPLLSFVFFFISLSVFCLLFFGVSCRF